MLKTPCNFACLVHRSHAKDMKHFLCIASLRQTLEKEFQGTNLNNLIGHIGSFIYLFIYLFIKKTILTPRHKAYSTDQVDLCMFFYTSTITLVFTQIRFKNMNDESGRAILEQLHYPNITIIIIIIIIIIKLNN